MAIQERLGGHFDYISFNASLKDETEKFKQIRKVFKDSALQMPDIKFEDKKNQVPSYDFTMPAFDTPPAINQMVGG